MQPFIGLFIFFIGGEYKETDLHPNKAESRNTSLAYPQIFTSSLFHSIGYLLMLHVSATRCGHV
jgi:hypothetical protein